jgi:hypothetical protein
MSGLLVVLLLVVLLVIVPRMMPEDEPDEDVMTLLDDISLQMKVTRIRAEMRVAADQCRRELDNELRDLCVGQVRRHATGRRLP